MLSAATESQPAEVGYAKRMVERYGHGWAERAEDAIAEEVPVAMVYNGVSFAVMMMTPLDLEDFALGFSMSEGLVRHAAQLGSIGVHLRMEGIELVMEVAELTFGQHPGAHQQRLLPGRSGCGLCGARTLEDAVRHPGPVGQGPQIDSDTLQKALSALRAAQPINLATGSVHAAAWVDTRGRIMLVREDVGRHNALDKLIGAMLRSGIDPEAGFLLVTSRASYEMVIKATTIGITIMAAISAPTALGIHLARDTGLTLIGFARADSHVVYTHPQRLRHAVGAST